MLQVYCKSCRLIVLVHALMETKIAFSKTDNQGVPWFIAAQLSGVNLAKSWGHQALVLSEAILVMIISRTELALMSTAPDNLFSMVTLAAVFVLLSKWSVLENVGQQMPGSSDSILARTIETLSHVACSSDHFAAKCARLIKAGVHSFRKKCEGSEPEPKSFSKPIVQHFTEYGPSSRSAAMSNGVGTDGYAAGSSAASMNTGGSFGPGPIDPQYSFPNLPMNDPNYFMNSDIFFDSDFWSTFMAAGP